MSSFVFPTLKGLTFDITRTPIWKTGRQESLSGKESRISYQFYPRIKYNLVYEVLRDDIATSDFRALGGLYDAMQGSFDTFLYTDPDFNTVTDENFGTGDGTTQDFQLTAKFQNSGGPGWPSIIQNLNGAPTIKKAGVTQTSPTNYTLGATGIIHFVTAPAAAAALTWTGAFYQRCRFTQDMLDFVKIMNRWWAAESVEFITIKL